MMLFSEIAVFISLICFSSGKSVVDDYHMEKVATNGYVFQGDMIMSKEDIDTAVHGGDTDNPTGNSAFSVIKSLSRRWPNGVVPYDLTGIKNKVLNAVGLKGPSEKAVISAMKEWQQKTCIRFIQRTTEKDYLKFIDDGFGKCYSYVGRSGGGQKLSLGFGCFKHGIALHEIGHALGLHHEQSRPDRDNYVEIIWDHIEDDKKYNFKKYTHSTIDSRGSPYDYGSIMHYKWNAFANWPWQRTIRSKKSGVSFGQRSSLSAEDAAQINSYYQCPTKSK